MVCLTASSTIFRLVVWGMSHTCNAGRAREHQYSRGHMPRGCVVANPLNAIGQVSIQHDPIPKLDE